MKRTYLVITDISGVQIKKDITDMMIPYDELVGEMWYELEDNGLMPESWEIRNE